jgi:hypothetical protein
VADLAFSAELPGDWVAHDLPDADDDFSDPTLFLPLAVVTSPYAPIVFAVGARPAYDDGTLHDWALYHIQSSGMRPRAIGEGAVGGLPAIVARRRRTRRSARWSCASRSARTAGGCST